MPRSSKKTTKKTAKKTTKKSTAKAAKKTVKKVTKKVAKKVGKKTATKKSDKRALVCANDEHCFWVSDGQVLKNLEELATALKAMHKDLFTYHAKGHSNDFADWVEHVLADESCAAELRKTRSQNGAHKVVIRHLSYYA